MKQFNYRKMKGLGAVLNHIADDIPSCVKASSSLSPTERIRKTVNDYSDEAVVLMSSSGRN